MRKKNLIKYYEQYYIEDIHYFFVNLKRQCSVDRFMEPMQNMLRVCKDEIALISLAKE